LTLDGLDYLAVLNQLLTFGPSVRSHIVRVEILDDVRFEKNVDKFTATLSTDNIIPRLHLGVQLATVNINDNDSESVLFHTHNINIAKY
jgi:hypothetical protein